MYFLPDGQHQKDLRETIQYIYPIGFVDYWSYLMFFLPFTQDHHFPDPYSHSRAWLALSIALAHVVLLPGLY